MKCPRKPTNSAGHTSLFGEMKYREILGYERLIKSLAEPPALANDTEELPDNTSMSLWMERKVAYF